MMGLANWVHWAAWYTKCLLFLMISLVLTTAILKVKVYVIVGFFTFPGTLSIKTRPFLKDNIHLLVVFLINTLKILILRDKIPLLWLMFKKN